MTQTTIDSLSRPASPASGRPDSVRDILARARSGLHEGNVSVGELVEALGRASFAPLLLLPAMIVVTPASGIPLLSSICGITIALVSLQMLMRRDHIWLPGWITRRAAPRDRLAQAFDLMAKPARFLDRVTTERLCVLVTPPVLILLQIICFLSGAVMPLLELVPFTSSMLAATVALLSVAMVTRDGLLVVIGFAILGAIAAVGHMLIT